MGNVPCEEKHSRTEQARQHTSQPKVQPRHKAGGENIQPHPHKEEEERCRDNKTTAAQFPSEIGKQAADVIYRLFDGENVDEDILIPVELITQENVNDFGIDRWQ